ncbi:hypothetical protein GH714_009763 [Hevea brasiliensis]|uniref:TF-B3 domain-containing protein n=1 Tax=Hevea brasiliensis TaxID=3981 RepID=A0A6A6NGC6_HEVBR|nr:hypothetical protein GH714_009763 [Hevea brasiliensis]
MGSSNQVGDATFMNKLDEITKAAEDESEVLEDFHVKKVKNASLEGNGGFNFFYPFGILIPKKKRTPRIEIFIEKSHGTVEEQAVTEGIICYGDEYSQEEEEEQKRRKSNTKSSRKRCSDGDTEKEGGKGGASKKPKKEGVDFAKLGFEQAPDLPCNTRIKIKEMGGTEIALVIMKQLSRTDLSKHHNRISMPVKQTMNEFLTVEEKERLNHRDSKQHLKGIDVMVVGPSESDEVTKMCLKKWDMSNNSSYVLVSGWYSLVKTNMELLKENAIAQFWSFRLRGELWFRLIIVRERDRVSVDGNIEGSGDGVSTINNGELMSTSHSSSITY